MADYSDSENESEVEFTTTSVLLGYVLEDEAAAEDTISHIGGIPTWLDEKSPMDSRLAKCLSCNNLMPLLLQINGDLPDAPHQERMLYLFGCKAKECRKKPGSIRAIRGAKPTGISRKQPNGDKVAREESVNPSNQPTKVNMGDMIFGSSASSGGNPTNPFSSSNVNPFASSANTNPFASPPSPTP